MNIIEMARQAGFITDFGCRETASDELLTRFAALVRNATLEQACEFYDAAFRCHHGHCADRGWAELTDWINEQAIEELDRANNG